MRIPMPRSSRPQRPTQKGCDGSTNIKNNARAPRLQVFSKASPTVSISNTNASCATTACLSPSPVSDMPTNFIPFPSSPIPCPTGRNDVSQKDTHPILRDFYEEELSAAALDAYNDGGASQTVVRNVRKRAKSSLSWSEPSHNSLLQRGENNLYADPGLLIPRRSARRMGQRKLESRSADGGGRKLSILAGGPPQRRARKERRSVSDAQFLAIVHQSIAWRARNIQANLQDAFAAEDIALAKRLWLDLIAQGCQPVDQLPCGRRANEVHDASSAPPPTTCVPSAPLATRMPPPYTLTMPQLVAVLTLRHRDRSASRSRSKDEKVELALPARPPSSLSRIVFSE
ncbi:hypothetical protein BKA93DRAFT_822266 [Sparassis latifolia]